MALGQFLHLVCCGIMKSFATYCLPSKMIKFIWKRALVVSYLFSTWKTCMQINVWTLNINCSIKHITKLGWTFSKYTNHVEHLYTSKSLILTFSSRKIYWKTYKVVAVVEVPPYPVTGETLTPSAKARNFFLNDSMILTINKMILYNKRKKHHTTKSFFTRHITKQPSFKYGSIKSLIRCKK